MLSVGNNIFKKIRLDNNIYSRIIPICIYLVNRYY